jgi:hypothetical protein
MYLFLLTPETTESHPLRACVRGSEMATAISESLGNVVQQHLRFEGSAGLLQHGTRP